MVSVASTSSHSGYKLTDESDTGQYSRDDQHGGVVHVVAHLFLTPRSYHLKAGGAKLRLEGFIGKSHDVKVGHLR